VLYLVDPDHLESVLPGQPGFRTDQLRQWLYEHPVLDTAQMTNLPGSLRADIADRLWPFDVETAQRSDSGTTRKWLLRAQDGVAYEAVLMGYPNRVTLCLSSQAGCALGCTFCATGQFGFDRHLDAGEIFAQLAYARADLANDPMPGCPGRVSNVVFMGMGEPLANYDRVREALRRMIDVSGMSARSITVSTVGVVPGMLRLSDEPWQVNLAVSLHAADDELRSSLLPINDRYPLSEVEAACANYFEKKGRRVSLEWTMIDGVNDTDIQAAKLADIALRLRAHVNLIAMNPTPLTDTHPSSPAAIDRFVGKLRDRSVNVTVRDTRGRDIDAACGQLRARVEARRPRRIALITD
jgi:23S rRNA (adenine2503-C2)-methyltransferase